MIKKSIVMSFFLTICLLLTLTAGPVLAQGETTVYTKVNSSFSVGNNYSYASSTIPSNSTIYHTENGITEIYGPNKKLLLSAKDSEASQITTPYGRTIPATRVQQIPDGSYIDYKENVTKVYSSSDRKNCILTIIDQTNGSNTKSITQDSDGKLTAPAFSDWVEYTYSNTHFANINIFDAYWKVPNKPPKPARNAVNYIFNGLRNIPHNILLQPVLEWNHGGSGRWTASAWFMYFDQQGYEHGLRSTSTLKVNTGDTIRGNMVYLPSGNCWQIAVFVNNKVSRQISVDGSFSFGSTQFLQPVCALEGWNINSNNDICGKTEFYNMYAAYNGAQLNIPWRTFVNISAPLTNLSVKVLSSANVILYTANK